jgi:hypothetical protein
VRANLSVASNNEVVRLGDAQHVETANWRIVQQSKLAHASFHFAEPVDDIND